MLKLGSYFRGREIGWAALVASTHSIQPLIRRSNQQQLAQHTHSQVLLATMLKKCFLLLLKTTSLMIDCFLIRPLTFLLFPSLLPLFLQTIFLVKLWMDKTVNSGQISSSSSSATEFISHQKNSIWGGWAAPERKMASLNSLNSPNRTELIIIDKSSSHWKKYDSCLLGLWHTEEQRELTVLNSKLQTVQSGSQFVAATTKPLPSALIESREREEKKKKTRTVNWIGPHTCPLYR